MDTSSIGRLLITFGVVVVLVGVVLVLAGKLPLFGRLPGDFVFHKDGFTLFAPITTMIIVSVVLTILVNLFFRFFR